MRKVAVLFAILLLLLSGCSNSRAEIEMATSEYESGMETDLKTSIENSTYADLILDSDISVSVSHDKTKQSYGEVKQKVNITVHIKDEYDNYDFPQQYDIAHGLFSTLRSDFSSLQEKYKLFNYWLSDEHEKDYCKAFDLTYSEGLGSVSNDWDFEYCVKTSNNSYYCTDTLDFGDEYFKINDKEYYDTSFKVAYGTASNYDLLTSSDKQSIREYIQGRYDYYDSQAGGYSGDKYSDEIWKDVAEKWGITEQQVTLIWANID